MTRLDYHRRRAVDIARTLSHARELQRRERWPHAALDRHRQQRLQQLVHHAASHSPLWRERLAGALREPVELAKLPVLDKQTLMERFDELICDRRLSRAALLTRLDGIERDELYLGEYRAMASSGSSGRKGLFVYDRDGWVGILAQLARANAIIGLPGLRLPRLRSAGIGGGSATHMSRRIADTLAGATRLCSLPATLPLDEIVSALNEFQPDCLSAYPSIAALLAEEQASGSLRIAPRWVSTSGELCSAQTAERIGAAFGVRPANQYATTEGLWGCSCEHGQLHLFDDMTLVENVDSDGRPAPPGTPGTRLLVTNLFNRVQPLIRFEIADVITVNPEPCACGRSLLRLAAIEGRADDVLWLSGAGGPVAAHPLQFAALTSDRNVREFQICQEGELLRVPVVLAQHADSTRAILRIHDALTANLRRLGVAEPRIEVQPCAALQRPASGKLRLVIADPAHQVEHARGH